MPIFSFFLVTTMFNNDISKGHSHLCPAVHITARLLSIVKDTIFYFVRMCTCSFLPRPKTMVIAQGARQAHEKNRELTSSQYTRPTQYLHVVVGKAYEHHIGKGLHSAITTLTNSLLKTVVNQCKARMVSCQYSFLCCSWSVVM